MKNRGCSNSPANDLFVSLLLAGRNVSKTCLALAQKLEQLNAKRGARLQNIGSTVSSINNSNRAPRKFDIIASELLFG